MTHFNGEHVSFQGMITHLKFHVFIIVTTFHGSPIYDHYFEIVDIMDIIVHSLGAVVVN